MELIVTEKLVQAVVEDADVTFPAIDGCVHMKVVMPSWYEEHLQSSYKETLKPHFDKIFHERAVDFERYVKTVKAQTPQE